MAIVISAPGPNALIGPGQMLIGQISAGPIPVDDFISAEASDPADGSAWPMGTHVTGGALSSAIMLGFFEVTPALGYTGKMAVGANWSVTISQQHADGTVVASSPPVTFRWDPYSGLWALMNKHAATVQSHEELDAILAAVTKTFPSIVS